MGSSPQKKELTHEQLISDKEGFEYLSKLLHVWSGIYMESNEKNYSLMSNRLHKVLVKYQCNSYSDFKKVIESNNNKAINEFIDVLTTNTTYFFRENEHFNNLKKYLPIIEKNLQHEKRNELRVWCAATSTGEEAYTILITLLEFFGDTNKITIKMSATDINLNVLEKAKEGIYKQEISENITDDLLVKYFEKNIKNNTFNYQVKEKYRKMINFYKHNLKTDNYIFPNKFDIIFCRNVLIYFTQNIVEETILKLSNCLDKKGYLFIGHSESMIGNKTKLKSISPSIYQLI